MSDAIGDSAEGRVLVLAPTPKDAALTRSMLDRAHVPCVVCTDIAQLCERLQEGAAAVLLPEEATAFGGFELTRWLAQQPAWSDVPVLILARPGADSSVVAQAMDNLGNVTVLERPTRVAALISAIRTALRARQRQYQIRDHLAERERAQQRLFDVKEQLATTLESITDGFMRFDSDWRVVYLNNEAERLGQHSRAEALGRTVWELWPALVGTHVESEYRRAVAEFVTIELENFYAPWDRWFTIKGYPSPDGGLSIFYQDITERKRAWEQVAHVSAESDRQRRLFDVVLSNTPDLAYVFDLNHRFTFANQALLSMWGRTWDEAIGKTCLELGYEPWHADMHNREIDTVAATKEPIRGEVFFTGTHGKRLYDYILVPVLGVDGEVEAVAGTTRDVTDVKEATQQLRRSADLLTFLIDRSPYGFYIVDADFRISHVNADSQARAFRNVQPAVGRRLDEAMRILWPEPLATEIINIFRHTLDTGEPYRSPGLVSERHDLETVEMYEWQLDRIMLPDGSYGVVCYYYDTTRLRAAEQSLRDADRRKDEFLATLAHELRNPLAPLRNGLQVMKLGKSDPATVDDVRAMMERQLAHMVRLIDDLLDLSRITRGKVELKRSRVELMKVLQQAMETSRPLIELGGHQLVTRAAVEQIDIHGDFARLSQVFANLLNNAAKYTEPGGRITLSVERHADEVIVLIRDTGIGIPAPMLPRVFEMFTQVDRSLEKSQGGLGIGLSLVKFLVEMHGGSVEARSDGVGQGSQFVVRLPILLTAAGHEHNGESDASSDAAKPHRILVVDDNRDAAITLAMVLSIMGNETRTAHDGLEALAAAAEFRPDVALLDIGMPKLNGYDTARRMREEAWGREIVLIALTGWGQEEDRRRSQDAGFNFHLVKPVAPGDLKSLLHSLPR